MLFRINLIKRRIGKIRFKINWMVNNEKDEGKYYLYKIFSPLLWTIVVKTLKPI